jgi:AcrR family transcriptional regulator
LPAGRHGLPREFVAEDQRERIVAGLAKVAASGGYHEATVARIIAAAGVSRKTFYEHFPDREACLLAACDVTAARIRELMSDAAAGEQDRPQQVRAAIYAALSFLAANRDLARLILIESSAVSQQAFERQRAYVRELAEAFEAYEPLAPRPSSLLSGAAGEAVVGGLMAVIVRYFAGAESGAFEEFVSETVELALTALIGAEEAARLARSAN